MSDSFHIGKDYRLKLLRDRYIMSIPLAGVALSTDREVGNYSIGYMNKGLYIIAKVLHFDT